MWIFPEFAVLTNYMYAGFFHKGRREDPERGRIWIVVRMLPFPINYMGPTVKTPSDNNGMVLLYIAHLLNDRTPAAK
jgi:hypothetical protein